VNMKHGVIGIKYTYTCYYDEAHIKQ